jgi:hypothetical protein
MTTKNDGAAADEVETAGRILRMVFRPDAMPLLAGAPAYVDGVISLRAGDPVALLTSGARATGRSREYAFTATGPDGIRVTDPFADAVEMGWVETFFQLAPSTPVTEHLLLNQFLTLERVRDAVPDGDTTELVVQCARVLRLQGYPNEDAPTATAELHLRIRRDDAAVRRRYDQAAEAIMATEQFDVFREQRLVELVCARNELVVDALTSMTSHRDSSVAARAQQALAALS